MKCGYCWASEQFITVRHGKICDPCGSTYHQWVKDPLVYPDTYAGELIYPPEGPAK